MRRYVGVVLCMLSINADAALNNGDNLSFTLGSFEDGTHVPEVGVGSWFSMEVSPGFNLYTPIESFNGINLGTVQPASGSHSGAPDGSESPDIDKPWVFFGQTSMHLTTAPTNVLSASGNTAAIDFSGWAVTFSGIPVINMGSNAWGGNPDGVAIVTCAIDCGDGDSYILDYTAITPLADPSGFGGVRYALHLEGYVSAIPVPAAIWLFCSGLLGLIGIARRRAGA